MTELIVTGGTVITLDDARRVIPDGAVALRGGRIMGVGTAAEIAARFPKPARVLDAKGKAVLPGLIDTHAHAGHGLVKTMGNGGPEWSEACRVIYSSASPAAFWYAEARLAGLERLKAGVTTGVSVLGGGDCIMRLDTPAAGEARARAIAEIGIRDIMAVGPRRPPFPHDFVMEDGSTRAIRFEDMLETMGLLFERVHDRGRMRLCTFMPVYREATHDAAKVAEIKAQGRAVRELGARFKARFHQDGHRTNSIVMADEMFGLLGPDAFLSHCTDLSDEDIATLVKTGAHVIHNPTAIAAVRGFCPVVKLLDAGVNVAVASDGTAPDRSGDMFRHAFEAMRYAQRAARDDSLIPPGRALEMITVDAAAALGMEREIGSLEEGKRADLITVDLTAPHMVPANMPVWRVVCYATAADVRDVVVGGELLMEGRRVAHLDEAEIVAAAEAETAQMLRRSGLSHLVAEDPGWRRTRR
ncbi:amidohydrolase family protein [Roseococcus sp. SDR]|uniref:amidohydrolase family protein n=1 Tax=Roseococcus sp. SDR TaxID=2835532 RepID=UPI001BD03266|nr:amidohydrolase family protein [Roseococcus sp. SDR]MBS7792150.1 amidohydrolase family protein [Roseococcus sp. SDR]MBV1847464.1 amidohydrolase family protein [Roseococcus sp. SDR]